MNEKIKKLFEKTLEKYPWISTIAAFNNAINKQKVSRSMVVSLFKELVDKEDWKWVPLSEMIDSCMINVIDKN